MDSFVGSFSAAAFEILGAVLVALIAGVVSLVGLIISKEQKLSEFREQWIDSLRSEISSLVSHAMMINAYCHMFLKKINKEHQEGKIGEDEYQLKLKQFYDDSYEDYAGMNAVSAKIKLRLNRTEPEAGDLLRKMKDLEDLFNTGPVNIDGEKIPALVSEIEQVSVPLLKNEWKRVKDGEPTYRLAKRLCLIISSVLAVALVAMIIIASAFMFGFATGS
jgi:hypothetical protein